MYKQMSMFLLGTCIFPLSLFANPLPPIKKVVSFGDSLTDAGTYGFRFTTNPGYTFAQHIAINYEQIPLPNQILLDYSKVYVGIPALKSYGGLNYAQGGARVNQPYSIVSNNPEGTPISVYKQFEHFLNEHKKFSSDELITLYIGTNDVIYNFDLNNDPVLAKQLRNNIPPTAVKYKQEKERVKKAALDTVNLVDSMLKHGANRIILLDLPQIGNSPWFRTPQSQKFMNDLSSEFNTTLHKNLKKSKKLLVIHTQEFIDEILDNPDKYKITHGNNQDACAKLDQDFCFPNSLVEIGADQTYMYAAGVHLTSRANQLLAEYILKKIEINNF